MARPSKTAAHSVEIRTDSLRNNRSAAENGSAVQASVTPGGGNTANTATYKEENCSPLGTAPDWRPRYAGRQQIAHFPRTRSTRRTQNRRSARKSLAVSPELECVHRGTRYLADQPGEGSGMRAKRNSSKRSKTQRERVMVVPKNRCQNYLIQDQVSSCEPQYPWCRKGISRPPQAILSGYDLIRSDAIPSAKRRHSAAFENIELAR